jgi:hypothetical protein
MQRLQLLEVGTIEITVRYQTTVAKAPGSNANMRNRSGIAQSRIPDTDRVLVLRHELTPSDRFSCDYRLRFPSA